MAFKNVAKLLGVTKPPVHKALEILINKGLLEKAHYGSAKLTQAGVELAEKLEARQGRLLLLFSKTLGLSMDESSAAATLLMSELGEDSHAKLESHRT